MAELGRELGVHRELPIGGHQRVCPSTVISLRSVVTVRRRCSRLDVPPEAAVYVGDCLDLDVVARLRRTTGLRRTRRYAWRTAVT